METQILGCLHHYILLKIDIFRYHNNGNGLDLPALTQEFPMSKTIPVSSVIILNEFRKKMIFRTAIHFLIVSEFLKNI